MRRTAGTGLSGLPKATVTDFVEDEDGFVHTEFCFNKPITMWSPPSVTVGQDNVALYLDLSIDPDAVAGDG